MTAPDARPWWSLLPPVTLPVECIGREHVVRWMDGELRAVDHPDADRERALVALGADTYPCLEFTGAWTRHVDDLTVLVLAARRPGEPVESGGPEDPSGPMHPRSRGSVSWTMGSASRGRRTGVRAIGRQFLPDAPDGEGTGELGRLIRAGRGLGDRLAAGVIATWAERIEQDAVGPHRSALRAALYGRALDVVRTWTGNPQQAIDVAMIGSDEPPLARRASDGSVRLELPFSWLRDVWAPGLAVSFGHLVLAAHPRDDGWALTAIDHTWGQPRTLTVTW